MDSITDSVDLSLSKFWQISEGQGSLAVLCYSPWGHKELDVTEQLNNSNKFSSSVALATFEVPSSHRGLMVSMLGSAEIECSQHPCKFY